MWGLSGGTRLQGWDLPGVGLKLAPNLVYREAPVAFVRAFALCWCFHESLAYKESAA